MINEKFYFYRIFLFIVEPGTFPDLCLSQPCLNGGQCTSYGYKFECTCPSGFEGRFCELDARVCQTQQPCGQSPDARCQSFRFGAALSHCCTFQEGLAYGFSVGQSMSELISNLKIFLFVSIYYSM